MAICVICQQETSKYKCPKCYEAYCSLECCKKHKDTPECLEKLRNSTSDAKAAEDCDNEPTIHEPFKTEDTVPQSKLKELGLNNDLKNLLYNPHLRNLLREIDTAPNAWKAIRAAMHEPLFLEFADECLKVVEPISQEDKA